MIPGSALRAEVPVYLYVFDLLWADGREVRPLPLRERKRLLRGLLSFRDPLRFTEHRDAVIGGYTDPRRSRIGFGALLLGYYDRDGKLGIPRQGGHRLRSAHPDEPARGPGRPKRPDPPFEPVRGLPRSGLHWVEPRLVAQVGFTEWTADGRLRHPRFQGLRRDKNPADVVQEMP